MPVPEAQAVSRLSYSGLASYHRCGYRFYLERVLNLPDVAPPPVPEDEEPWIGLPGEKPPSNDAPASGQGAKGPRNTQDSSPEDFFKNLENQG